MKNKDVIKNIKQCKKPQAENIKEHTLIGEILRKGTADKKQYLHEDFMEENEGEIPMVGPPEMLRPIF